MVQAITERRTVSLEQREYDVSQVKAGRVQMDQLMFLRCSAQLVSGLSNLHL